MKTRKTFFIAAMVAVSGLVIAQGFGGGMGGARMSTTDRANREAEQLKTALTLDAGQVTKLKEVSLKFAKQDSVSMAAMMAGGGQPDFEKMREQRTATQEAKTKEINAILTPDQQAKYKTYQTEQQQRRQQGMGGGMGGPQQ